ncbi:uncharacterized protein N7515_002958 [Penicillium bovifimosum]|uniref:Uncharacterized protein n=1 Tax=Penicillium bovifimosum TaxID=126998 RepID=A0A9W9HEC1_9EURO|nr:uncharacterized protein N7515_002958 [Penicillium bovifimosum]KAJ5144171.1 hypothetical protein N7515_002958 [Penicillium bovifimosum]
MARGISGTVSMEVSKEAVKIQAPPISKCAFEAAFLDDGVGQATPGRSRSTCKVDVMAADILAAADELIFALQGLVVLGSVVGSARQEGP